MSISHSLTFVIGIVIGLAITFYFFGNSTKPNPPISVPTASKSAAPAPSEVTQTVTAAQQTDAEKKSAQDQLTKYLTVQSALLGISDNFSLYFKNMNDQSEVSFNPTRSWIPASTIKAYVALEAFRQRDLGLINFSSLVAISPKNVVPTELETDDYPRLREGTTATVKQLVESMIIQSDNTAYNSLLDILDRRSVNQTLKNIGLTETVVGEKLNLDDTQLAQDSLVPGRQANTTTAKDLGTFFDLLYNHKIVDSEEILAIFEKQKINNMIPSLLPASTVIAHKTGDWAPIYHDGGVIFKPGSPFVLTVFTAAGDPEAISKMAEVAYYQNPSVVGSKFATRSEASSLRPVVTLADSALNTNILGASTPVDLTSTDLGITPSDLDTSTKSFQAVGSALLTPGNPFYGLKKWVESVRLNVATRTGSSAQELINQSKSRLSEIKSLLGRFDAAGARSVLAESEADLDQAVQVSTGRADQDTVRLKVKQLLDTHYALLSQSAENWSGSKSDLVDTIYEFYQKEHQQIKPQIQKSIIADPLQQKPLVGTVTKLTGKVAEVKLDNGSTVNVVLNSDTTTVRDFGQAPQISTDVIKAGEHIAVLGLISPKTQQINPQVIIRQVPKDLAGKSQGVVVKSDANSGSLEIIDAQGKTETVQVNNQTTVQSTDTNVGIEGIKAGSVVSIVGVATTVSATAATTPSTVPTATKSPTTTTSSSSASTKNTSKAAVKIKATSVRVVVNSSGKNEVSTKSK